MQSKVFGSFDEMVADVPDGASLLVAGFGPVGAPYNLLRALYEHGSKGHTVITTSAAGDVNPQIGITLADLIKDGRVDKVISSFTAPARSSTLNYFDEMYEAGKFEAEITSQGTLAERIRAGGAGIPAFFTPAGVGTDLAEGKEVRVFNGRAYLMEQAISADYALIRAWKADEFGNLEYKLTQRSFNAIMAMAAKHTLVEAEELVPLGSLDPDRVNTPGIYVERVATIPPDGVWFGLYGGASHPEA